MIRHVQPVALVQAVPVQRHGDVVDGIRDEERDDLFGELMRTVVVRRARDDHRHVVGRPVAVGEPIGARLARRVGIPRTQLVGLPARSVGHAAVDLVGRDLHEAPEMRRLPRGLEQHERAVDVGHDELTGAHQRSIDVRLGGEVDDDVGGDHERRGGRRVRHVAAHERVPRIVEDLLEILQPSGVGQLVERRDVPVRMRREGVAHEVRPDEPGAAGHENVNHLCVTSRTGAPRAARGGIRRARRADRARSAR